MAGRPKKVDKKIMISVKLPKHIVEWLRENETSQAVVIEQALMKELRPTNLNALALDGIKYKPNRQVNLDSLRVMASTKTIPEIVSISDDEVKALDVNVLNYKFSIPYTLDLDFSKLKNNKKPY